VPIVLGILVATLANHAFAGALGAWITTQIGPSVLRFILGGSFIAMGIWALWPDSEPEHSDEAPRFGVFVATVVAFFLVEMGDKTQVATVALAARFESLIGVVAGTTIGMMLANVPVVLLGDVVTKKLPLEAIRWGAAALFIALGGYVLLFG
jgi:putative Ca2+/H+ antiporter (TMEM165/GDT1 family)